jgi:FkbM family methyltransferase
MMDEFNPAKSIWLPRLSILILLHAGWVAFRVTGRPFESPGSFAPGTFWLLLLPALLYPAVMATWLSVLRRKGDASLLAFFRRPANFVSYSRPFFLMIGVTLGALLIAWPQSGISDGLNAGPSPVARSVMSLTSALLVAFGFMGDFLDGYLARRETPESIRRWGTPVEARLAGPWLDAESDSLAVYFSSAALVGLSLAPEFLMIPAIARYAYAIPSVLMPPRLHYPLWSKWYSKTAAALLQCLVAAYWISAVFGIPSGGPVFQSIAIIICSMIGISFAFSFWFRFETAFRLLPVKRPGLLKSWLVYYIVPFVLFPARFRRMIKLYGTFIRPGDLVYDVGSHLGNRISVFLYLGARVRAFEPQADCIPPLKEWFGTEQDVSLRFAALGDSAGETSIYVSRNYPTLSSIDPEWVRQRSGDRGFSNINWEEKDRVPVTTMDSEIRQSGIPAFTKIDVEGFEAQVLKGNSATLPALSFEFLPSDTDRAMLCLDEIERIAVYEFNYSPGESMRLVWDEWRDAGSMRDYLDAYPLGMRSGDVYARLK